MTDEKSKFMKFTVYMEIGLKIKVYLKIFCSVMNLHFTFRVCRIDKNAEFGVLKILTKVKKLSVISHELLSAVKREILIR